jgi:hypothetical protein
VVLPHLVDHALRLEVGIAATTHEVGHVQLGLLVVHLLRHQRPFRLGGDLVLAIRLHVYLQVLGVPVILVELHELRLAMGGEVHVHLLRPRSVEMVAWVVHGRCHLDLSRVLTQILSLHQVVKKGRIVHS